MPNRAQVPVTLANSKCTHTHTHTHTHTKSVIQTHILNYTQLVLGVPLHLVRLWAFFGIMLQVPLVLITEVRPTSLSVCVCARHCGTAHVFVCMCLSSAPSVLYSLCALLPPCSTPSVLCSLCMYVSVLPPCSAPSVCMCLCSSLSKAHACLPPCLCVCAYHSGKTHMRLPP